MREFSPYTMGRLARRENEKFADNPYLEWLPLATEWGRGWSAENHAQAVAARPGLSVGALLEQMRAAGNVK